MYADERAIVLDISEPDDGVVATLAQLDGDLMLLGAGGKIGHGLALMARRAFELAGKRNRVVAVSRFSSAASRQALEADGIATISCDLADVDAVRKLPDCSEIVYMVGQKFGTADGPSTTWLLNTVVPGVVAQRWSKSRMVAYSSGNIYPFVAPESGGCDESTPPGPVGEYAQSVLGRERVLEYYSHQHGTPVCIIRLNYAVEPRYGVLVDLATKIIAREPIDLAQGHVNVIWQGDNNRYTLRAFELVDSPPKLLNLTGPQIEVRSLATQLGRALGIEPTFTGQPAAIALLNNSAFCWQRFGPPHVDTAAMIERVASWLKAGGQTMGKPTHFEARDGKF